MRSTRILMPLALAGIALVACDDSSPSGVEQARLSIQLTDAPGDLEEAHIRIEEFILIGAGDEHDDDGFIRIQPEVPGFIDLLTLAGGQVLDIVDDAVIPEGSYSELRLVLDDAWVRLSDGRVFATAGADLPTGVTADGTLRCPSCSQSGFKVKFANDGLQVSGEETVLIDFDVAQSFGHEAGASGQWIMRPVLRATTQNIQLGRIVGTVGLGDGVTIPECGGQTNSLVQFRPIAVMGADTITAAVNEEGEFRFSHVMPGTWTLGNMPFVSFTNADTLSFTATPSAATVTVAAGDSAMATYLINTAICG